jgi:hypothetical protein
MVGAYLVSLFYGDEVHACVVSAVIFSPGSYTL